MDKAGIEPFGSLDGIDYHEVTIRSRAGAEAKVITFGAVIRDLVVPSAAGPQHVCLGLNTIEDYKRHSPYFGAIVGRFANRIASGAFTLDGETHRLSRNERGITTLHGGTEGFGVRAWTITALSDSSVTLTLHSADGDMGFPGALDVTCTYTMLEPASLRYELTATTDAPTIVNLTNHAYFNLDGMPDVLDHVLTINAEQRTAVDRDLIPTGEILPVAGTPFDFRTPRTLRNPAGQDYDLNFVLSGTIPGQLVHAARASSTKSGVVLDVYTDQPGIQLYDGTTLQCSAPGLGGVAYGRFAGFCLETQLFPDAPNHPNFPSSVLRPGETYRNLTEFRFG